MKRNDHPSRATPVIDPQQVRASDVMHTDVLALRADDPIRAAVEQLEEVHASGAPVVDAAGNLLGVLTLSDIARSEHLEDGSIATGPEGHVEARAAAEDDDGVDEEMSSTDAFRADVLGRTRVADWMTRGITHVAPDETVAAVCRAMIEEGIHRVFVIDRGRLQGVVSAKDIVRLLAEPRHSPPQPRRRQT